MIKILILCAIFANSICVTKEEEGESYISSQKIMSVIDSYTKELKKKKFHRRGYGLDGARGDKVSDRKIHTIAVAYSIDRNLKFHEARQLFYEVVDGLIAAFNRHPEVGQYLYHYPIGYEDLDVGLAFDYTMKGTLKKDDIDSIYIGNNEIVYFVMKNDSPPQIEIKQITPDVGLLQGFGNNTRSIRHKLPEDPVTLPKMAQ